MAMTEEDRELWVSALEDGTRRQGERFLKQINEKGDAAYCCLGVLCEVKGIEENYGDAVVTSFRFPREDDTVSIRSDMPEVSWMSSLGISVADAQLLASMNDNRWSDRTDLSIVPNMERRKYTFPEIAAFIRKHL